jgi:hypothetical protein
MAHPGMTKGNSRELFPDSIVKQPCTVIASEAKQSMEPQERLDCFVASLLAMTSKHTPAFPRRDAPELLRRRALEKQRAQGMPDARRVRSRVRSEISTRVSHHGHAGNVRHSPRNGFNSLFRALPGDRAFLPPSSVKFLSPT